MKLSLNLEQRFFVSILSTAVLVSGLLLAVAFYFVSEKAKSDYFNKYQALSAILGNTLLQLEQNTDMLMENAAKVVQSKYRADKLFEVDQLKNIAASLNLTHIFIIDTSGRFVRSTNEDPRLIPNLFSFSEKYRQLLTGEASVFRTPIIPPEPELNPYKFVMVPSFDKKYILEVGIKAEFISRTLSQALRENLSLKEINLYAPNGTSLGSITRDANKYQRKISNFDELGFNQPVDSGDTITYFTRVNSSQPVCHQCDKSSLTRAGEYYYILESRVSKAELSASVRSLLLYFLALLVLSTILSFFAARIISKRLVEKIQALTSSINQITLNRSLKARVPEIADPVELRNLAASFNILLETIDGYQTQIVDSQKGRAEMEIAREVAHDIRSPLSALQVLAGTVKGVPKEWEELLQKSCSRIQAIADDLMSRHSQQKSILIGPVLNEVIREKRLLYPALNFEISIHTDLDTTFAVSEKSLFARVLSNLINNAAEAQGNLGNIRLNAFIEKFEIKIQISDEGPGFDASIIDRAGKVPGSTKGKNRGFGLLAASRIVGGWGGKFEVRNLPNGGAVVEIFLPIDMPASAFKAGLLDYSVSALDENDQVFMNNQV